MTTQQDIKSTNPGFEWGVIFAGAAVACAISIVLMQFGSVIGLSADGPLTQLEDMATWAVIATGIWILWVQLLASLAGGYSAGYLRRPTPAYKPHENELHDGFYGFAVWAISTIAVFTAISIAAISATYIEVETGIYNVDGTMSDSEKIPLLFLHSLQVQPHCFLPWQHGGQPQWAAIIVHRAPISVHIYHSRKNKVCA